MQNSTTLLLIKDNGILLKDWRNSSLVVFKPPFPIANQTLIQIALPVEKHVITSNLYAAVIGNRSVVK